MADSPTIGYVPGGWDMFHVGHLNILRSARAACDRLVVGVVGDEVLRQAKGRAPMYPFAERMQVVEAFRLADEVVLDPSSDKTEAWRAVRFDVLFKGDDWRGTPKGDRLEAQMAAVGARVHYFPYTRHVSSSALREHAEAQPDGNDKNRFRVLIVCVANECRSVLGEYLLRQAVEAAGLNWEISSAGTSAVDDQPPNPEVVSVLAREEIDAANHRSRRLTREMCERADLILAVTDQVRDAVAAVAPPAGRRVYTLLPFAHLLAGVPGSSRLEEAARGHEILRRAAKARTLVPTLRAGRDIADPTGQRTERFEACAAALRTAFMPLVEGKPVTD